MNFDDPIATALKAAQLLERADVGYGLYGGLAVAAWGVPRETKDADIAVVSANAGQLVELLRGDGIDATAAFERVQFGGLIISRGTLLAGREHTGLNTIDLVEPASARYAALAVSRVDPGGSREGPRSRDDRAGDRGLVSEVAWHDIKERWMRCRR